jgi:hypothetical protein
LLRVSVCGSSAATKLNCSQLLHDLGIFTSPAAAKWAEKLQLDLPIIQTVAKVQQTIVFLLILPVVQPRQFASQVILEQITVQEATSVRWCSLIALACVCSLFSSQFMLTLLQLLLQRPLKDED